jgi:hypothetical protein
MLDISRFISVKLWIEVTFKLREIFQQRCFEFDHKYSYTFEFHHDYDQYSHVYLLS